LGCEAGIEQEHQGPSLTPGWKAQKKTLGKELRLEEGEEKPGDKTDELRRLSQGWSALIKNKTRGRKKDGRKTTLRKGDRGRRRVQVQELLGRGVSPGRYPPVSKKLREEGPQRKRGFKQNFAGQITKRGGSRLNRMSRLGQLYALLQRRPTKEKVLRDKGWR